MTDRPTSTPDDAAKGGSSSDYQAPKLYDSSDLLSKYRTPDPSVTPPEPGAAPDLASGSAAVADALAGSASSVTSTGSDSSVSFNDDDPYAASNDPYAPSDDVPSPDPTAWTGVSGTANATSTDWAPGASADDAARTALLGSVATAVNNLGNKAYALGADELFTAGEIAEMPVPEGDGWESIKTYAPHDADYLHNQKQKQARRGTPATAPAPLGSRGTTTATTPAPGKKSHQLIYWGVAAVIFGAFGVPWAAWPITIGVAIASIAAVTGKWGRKWIGYIGFILVGLVVVLQIFSIAGDSLFSGGDSGSSSSTETLDVTASSTITGSGSTTIDVIPPDGPLMFAVIDVTLTGDSIRIKELDSSGEWIGYQSYSMYREGTERYVINTDHSSLLTALDIEADGPWSITLLSYTSLESFDTSYTGGEGEQLLVYSGGEGDALFTLDPEDSMEITTYYPDGPTWSNGFYGVSAFTAPWQAGPVLIEIEAFLPWSVEVVPPGSGGGAPGDGGDSPEDEAPLDDEAPVDDEEL